jgi:hypothetical protein
MPSPTTMIGPSLTDLAHVKGLRGGVLDRTRTVSQTSITLKQHPKRKAASQPRQAPVAPARGFVVYRAG